jgi:hypothetical protein
MIHQENVSIHRPVVLALRDIVGPVCLTLFERNKETALRLNRNTITGVGEGAIYHS